MRKLQEKHGDQQAARNELMSKRMQEENDRAWRKKEQAELKKEEDTILMLRDWREKQIEHKRHFLSQYVARNRADFARILK